MSSVRNVSLRICVTVTAIVAHGDWLNFGSCDLENLPYLHVLEMAESALCSTALIILLCGSSHVQVVCMHVASGVLCTSTDYSVALQIPTNVLVTSQEMQKEVWGRVRSTAWGSHHTGCILSTKLMSVLYQPSALTKGKTEIIFLLASFCFCHVYRFRSAVVCKLWFCISH